MKRNFFIVVLVVVFAGVLFQSCEKEVVCPPNSISPTTNYAVIKVGDYSNGKYQLPVGGIVYTSKEGVKIFYCENRKEYGKEIYEEIFNPRNSIGVEYADWSVGDTVVWEYKNPKQIVRIEGSFEVLEVL